MDVDPRDQAASDGWAYPGSWSSQVVAARRGP
jgi:hypothetical protein